MLSFIDHTPERFADHSERQARRSCHARYDQRPDSRLRNIHREYAQCGANAHGKGILTPKIVGTGVLDGPKNAKLNKKVVPYRTLTTSEFDEGQQSFVRKILNFVYKCVVPIISHWYSLDDAAYSILSSLELYILFTHRKCISLQNESLHQPSVTNPMQNLLAQCCKK